MLCAGPRLQLQKGPGATRLLTLLLESGALYLAADKDQRLQITPDDLLGVLSSAMS